MLRPQSRSETAGDDCHEDSFTPKVSTITLSVSCIMSGCEACACRYGSDDAYEFTLENQAGQAMNFGKEDREAIVTTLMLHESAKKKLQAVSHLSFQVSGLLQPQRKS